MKSRQFIQAVLQGRRDDILTEIDGQSPFTKSVALMAAVEHQHRRIALDLLDANARALYQHPVSLETALLHAIHQRDTELALQLIRAQARLDLQDTGGYGALHLATREGLSDVVKGLIEAGANIDVRMHSRGKCALAIAAENGNGELCALLLAHDADPNLLDYNNSTALTLALQGGHTVCARVLLEHGAFVGEDDQSEDAELKPLIAARQDPEEWERHTELGYALATAETPQDVLSLLQGLSRLKHPALARPVLMSHIAHPLVRFHQQGRLAEIHTLIAALCEKLEWLGFTQDFVSDAEADVIGFAVALSAGQEQLESRVLEKLVPHWIRGTLAYNLACLYDAKGVDARERMLYFTKLAIATGKDRENFMQDADFSAYHQDGDFLDCLDHPNWNLEPGGPFDPDVNPKTLFDS